MACIATWSFGLESVKVAGDLLNRGVDCVEAVELAINSEFIGHSHCHSHCRFPRQTTMKVRSEGRVSYATCTRDSWPARG